MIALQSFPPVTIGRSAILGHNLKETLWNYENVARLERDITRDVAISNQIREMNSIGILLAVGGTDDHCVVSCGIPRQATDRDHCIEYGHVRAIGKRARLGGLADDAHLLGDRADKTLDDDGDQRLFNISTEPLFVFTG